jgi:dihydroorotate dehydrogenase
MSWLYRTLARPLLFTQESESIHNHTLTSLGWISRHEMAREAIASFFEAPQLPVSLFGLTFPNPVGLAAGMDKFAAALPAWAALGFGFAEIGGVTCHPQAGNPDPRLFRVAESEALINRMGFNNPGAAELARCLANWRDAGLWPNHPVGINLGKSKITPLKEAADDYAASLKVLWEHGDFFVVNVSSPNTPNLRQLQDKGALSEILAALQAVNEHLGQMPWPARPAEEGALRLNPQIHRQKPILVKVSPDLSFTALDEIFELVGPYRLAGIVATNTTTARPETSEPRLQERYAELGGLSGKPLRRRSTEIIRHIYQQTNGTLPIIGVGGIFDADDAWEKITAGASLVQVYTGLVYEGPSLARSIVTGLAARLSTLGTTDLSQAVGSGRREETRP